MAELFDIKKVLDETSKELSDISHSLDLENLNKLLSEEEEKMNEPTFWDDNKTANKILRHIKILKNQISSFDKLKNELDDINILYEMLTEDYNEKDSDSLHLDANTLQKKVELFSLETLLDGEYDSDNTILSIHPGAGGTESQDWAEMLLRMYIRYAEKNSFKVKMLEEQSGDVAGIKSATLLIEGINAYGFLKSEKGVHRLVRLSPFDSNNRRHTSFASVDIIPDIEDDVSAEINPSELRIDTYRAGGAGGQHVNKTDSAVRITHIPTKISVAVQNERSQRQNKETAMKILKAKLTEILKEEQAEKLSEIKGDYSEIAWGNQIRSYVFHPYNMVKDHRTNVETSNVQNVMDGDIDLFIDAYLKNKKREN